MGRARLIRGGKALNNRYVSSNAGFYDKVAFEKVVRDPSEPSIGFGIDSGKGKKKKSKTAKVKGLWKKRKPEPKVFACPSCGRTFASKKGMHRHDEDVHQKQKRLAKVRTQSPPPRRRPNVVAEPSLGIIKFQKVRAEMIAAGLIPPDPEEKQTPVS